MQRLFFLALLLGPLALGPPAAAQADPPPQGPGEALSTFVLATFVRDATTYTALPWQQEALGLSDAQVAALQAIAESRQRSVEELYAELRMLFETVGMLDRPVDAHEAFALYYEIAAHKGEALMTFHEAAAAMLDVLTPEQRAAWARVLEEATCEQCGPVQIGAAPSTAPPTDGP